MCHHHWPGDGIDMLWLDPNTAQFGIRLASNDCLYVLTLGELTRVVYDNPYATKGAKLHKDLSNDESVYSQCHLPEKAHEHRFNDLCRFETYPEGFGGRGLEVAVTYCNCHVCVPLPLIVDLLLTPAFDTWERVVIGAHELKAYMRAHNAREELGNFLYGYILRGQS